MNGHHAAVICVKTAHANVFSLIEKALFRAGIKCIRLLSKNVDNSDFSAILSHLIQAGMVVITDQQIPSTLPENIQPHRLISLDWDANHSRKAIGQLAQQLRLKSSSAKK